MPASPESKETDPPQDDEDRDQKAAAAAFGEALEEFEKSAGQTKAPASARKPKGSGPPRLGARVRGKVVSIAADVMLLDIGARSEAVADAREFRDAEGASTVNVGDSLELHVVEATEPLVLARTARNKKGKPSLEALRQARAAGLPVRGKVTATNKGGWTVDVDGVRAFCPLSQVDLQRVEDVTPFVGRVLEFLVTEVEESRARVIVSRRAHLARQLAEVVREKLAKLAPGQELEGAVTRLEPFGAFVDLGGLEGMVHISELSHSRIAHARDAVAVGDRVRVRVLKVDAADERRPRVSLSLRATTPDPWAETAAKFAVGARVPGVVVRLADFGAFVNLAPGVDGLVHVSQASDRRIQHVREVLSPGQAIEVFVLAVDPERKRISLSIRDALEHPIERSQMTRDAGAPADDRPKRESGSRRDSAPRRESGMKRGAGPRRERAPQQEEAPRQEIAPKPSSARPADEPLTAMQLAFRKAREAQQRREQRG